MNPGFFHFEAYAVRGSHGKPSIRQIIGEACRDEGFHPHVAEPKPPVVIRGLHPRELLVLIDNLMSVATDASRRNRPVRRFPTTFPILLGAVASYPLAPEALEADPANPEKVDKWVTLNVAFLDAEFGAANVKSIVMHLDEGFLHLHAYVVPTPDPITMAICVETISKPHAAQGAARREGGSRRIQREAFRAEAKKMQDRYDLMVGQPAQLARRGSDPNRRRRPRQEHLVQREAAEAIDRQKAEAEADRIAAQGDRTDAAKDRAEAAKDRANLYLEVDAEVERRVSERRDNLVRIFAANARKIEALAEEKCCRQRALTKQAIDELGEMRIENERLVAILEDLGIDPNATYRP